MEFIRIYRQECPICDNVHEIEVYRNLAKEEIQGLQVNYFEEIHKCSIDGEYFYPRKIIRSNLEAAMEAWLKLYCKDNLGKIMNEYKVIKQFLENKVDYTAKGWMKAQLTHFESFEQEITFEKINIFPDLMKRALEHKELIHYIIEEKIVYKEIEQELKNIDVFLTSIYENSPFFKEKGFRSRREVYKEVKMKYKNL
jgi:hypothetical protein